MNIPTMRQVRIMQALSEPKLMRHLGSGNAYAAAATLVQRGFVVAEKNYSLPGNPLVYRRTDKAVKLLELLK